LRERCDGITLAGRVFVHAESGGEQAGDGAFGGMQAGCAALEPARKAPGLERCVEQQREMLFRGHGR
jgi:hypothetical protein